MALLEYLVPSRARREILRALASRAGGLSVRQLSRAAGVAYSNAYREVDQMKRAGLVRTRPAGNAILCTWESRSPGARAVLLLLGRKAPDAPAREEENLFGNLRRWGAPLQREGSLRVPLGLEESLVRGLVLARRHPEVARVWPVVFAKNRSHVDLLELEFLAQRLGTRRALGFFLALSQRLLGDPRLASAVKRLRDQRVRKTEDFFLLERSKRARRLAEQNTPALAREWFFRMNMPLDSFQSLFDKFVPKK